MGADLGIPKRRSEARSPEPDWQRRVVYFLRALRRQKTLLEKKIERGRITIAEIVKLTGANRNTVKKHLAALVEANHLAQHGRGKGTWYGPGPYPGQAD